MSISQPEDQPNRGVERAVLAFERAFGRNHLCTLTALCDAGRTYADRGMLRQAETMYTRALEGYLSTHRQDHQACIHTMSNLGTLYGEWDKLAQAEEMLGRALAGYERTLGRYHETSLTTLQNLGLTYASQRRFQEAEDTYKIALEDMQRELGPDHMGTLALANNLGLFYKERGRFDDAETMYQWALQGSERMLGRDDKLTLTAMNGLGMLRRQQHRPTEAEELYKMAIEASEQKFGQDSALTLHPVTNLGNIYADQGQVIEAEEMYKRALRGWSKARGWACKWTLNAADRLRLLYTSQNRLKEAEEISRLMRRDAGESLHQAARNCDIVILRLLLDIGFPINTKSEAYWNRDGERDGSTALCVAAFHGFTEIVIELLSREANVDAASDSYTPLVMAAWKNHLDVVRILLDNGANANGVNGSGILPLVMASWQGHLDIVVLLLQRGARVEELDDDGDPALHTAALNGHIDIVRILLDNGANPRSKGGSGRTALWLATKEKHEAVTRLLRDYTDGDYDNQQDIPNDSSVALQLIGTNRLLADMETAQSLMRDNTHTQQPTRKLRFLIRGKSHQCNLELIEEDPEDPEPFIAVSYRSGAAASAADATPLVVYDPRLRASVPEGTRPARTRADVILRSFNFAESREIKRVWIGQECIDHGDGEDVQHAAQSTHPAFRRAAATAVILGRHVHTVEDISGLPDLLPRGLMPMTQQPSATIQDKILGDKWFTSAWCAAEQANSSAVYYLVGWRDGLDEDGREWKECARVAEAECGLKQSITKEWVIPSGYLWNMSFRSWRQRHMVISMISSTRLGGGIDTFSLLDDDMEEAGRHRPDSVLESESAGDLELSAARPASRVRHMHRPPHKLGCSMSSAFVTLREKETVDLLVSDRLAILANMTRYPFTINTKSVAEMDLSYTACILALALQNGDLNSFRFFTAQRMEPSASDDDGNATCSWLPPSNLSLEKLFPMPRGDFRSCIFAGDPCYVVGAKGLFRGLIWDIEAYDAPGFLNIRDTLPDLFLLACDEQCGERGFWIKTIIQLLIRHFISVGHQELAELIVLCSLPRQLNDPEEAQSLMDRFEVWVRDGHDEDWPSGWHTVPSGVGWGPAAGASTDADDSTRLDPSIVGRPLLHWVCQNIVSNKTLAVGRCLVQGDAGGDARTLFGLFSVDPTKHRKVFTPLSGIEYEFGASYTSWFPDRLFATVEEMGGVRPSDEEVKKSTRLLVSQGGSLLDPKIYRIQSNDRTRKAVWSHRLSRNGILEMNDRHRRTTFPLGQGEFWRRPSHTDS